MAEVVDLIVTLVVLFYLWRFLVRAVDLCGRMRGHRE